MTTDPQPAISPAPPPVPSSTAGSWSAPEPPTAAAAAVPHHHQLKRTRISGLWVAMGFFAVVLLLLLIFILQNGATVQVSYLGAHGRLPLGVAMLLSAVCGVLLVVLAGAARISQLRATARRHRRIDARRAAAASAVPSAQPAPPAPSAQPAPPAPSVHLAPSTHPVHPEPPTRSMPAVPDAPAAGPDQGR